MITSDKALAFPERLTSDMRPITADVFLTRRCNNNCSYCTYSRFMRRSGPEMDEASFGRLLGRLIDLGVKGVILTGGGEPTVAKCFGSVTRMLEGASMPYGINTNFNRYHEFRPAYLKVSLDGWDEASYKAARGVAAYGTVVENVKRYWAWKCENSPDTRLVLQMVAKDAGSVERFYSANRELPCDAMVFRPVESTLGKWYSGRDASETIEAVKAIGDDRVMLNPKFWQLGTVFDRCAANHMQIAVDESCNVVYCCHKPYEVVGSVFDDDILEKKRMYETDMGLCDVPCRLTSSNVLAERSERLRGMVDACFI